MFIFLSLYSLLVGLEVLEDLEILESLEVLDFYRV